MYLNIKKKIVDLAHETVTDPAKVEQFIRELSAIYDRSQSADHSSEPLDPQDNRPLSLAEAEQHFEQAASAFSRLWQQNDLREPFLSGFSDTVCLDRMGHVVAVNCSNLENVPFEQGQSVFDAQSDGDTWATLREALKTCVSAQADGILCFLPFYHHDGQRTVWALSRDKTSHENAVGRLSRVDFDWSEQAGAAITDSFGLTQSEQDIMKALVRGQNLAALAEDRQRSVETVRTQAKSLLAKTGVRSQLDLVRLFAAITLVSPELTLPVTRHAEIPAPPGSLLLQLPDNRTMQVEIHGPPTGRPVVFLHNMFSGTAMTQGVMNALHHHGIKLICPWRPGFAKSSPYSDKPEAPVQAFASDLRYLLDMLGVQTTVVVGHMSSSVYAAAAGVLLADRVHSVATVAGLPPFLMRRHIDRLPAFPRLFAYTSRYFPKALSLLVRGTFGLLIENRMEVLFDNLYAGAKCDSQLISSPEVREIFLNDFCRAFEQGTAGYEVDAALAATDWSIWLEKLPSGAMTFIHGLEDPVTPFTLIREVAGEKGQIKLVPVEEAGHLVFYNASEKVISEIADLQGVLRPMDETQATGE